MIIVRMLASAQQHAAADSATEHKRVRAMLRHVADAARTILIRMLQCRSNRRTRV